MLNSRHNRLYALLLGIATLFAFLPAVNNDFVALDDSEYIFNNPFIQSLSLENLKQMFGLSIYWMPLTWLSHAIDIQLFGLNAGGHHLVSILIHCLNVMLVYLLFVCLLEIITGEPLSKSNRGIIAASALLWGVHPLRVESVAWASERKDVLYAFFTLATLLFYVSFTQANDEKHRRKTYLLTLISFFLSLAAKPMAMTTPVVMLLIDWFPLRRTSPWKIKEKLPFFVLAFLGACGAILGQSGTNSFVSQEVYSNTDRILHAFRNISFYLEKTVWPLDIVPMYPAYRYTFFSYPVVLSMLLFVAISLLGFKRYLRKDEPSLLTAWLYYLFTLGPVMGLTLVGNQIKGDRWAYLPTLSFYLIAGWLICKTFERCRNRIPQIMVSSTLVAVLALLSVKTCHQIRIWKDSETFFGAIIERYPRNNSLPYFNLGTYKAQQKKFDEALKLLTVATEINPKYASAFHNRGIVHRIMGNEEAAKEDFQRVLEIDPNYNSNRNRY